MKERRIVEPRTRKQGGPAKRLSRGSTLLICLGTVLLATALATTLLSLSSTASRMSYRSWQKAQADALAESGVEQMYSQIANAYYGQSADTNPIAPTSVVGQIGGSSSSDGSYSASVVSSVTSTSGSVRMITYAIEGDGTSPDGKTTSKMIATFSESTAAPQGANLGDVAIKSAGKINMSGGSYTSDPTGTHGAGVSANDTVNDGSPGLTIDGTAFYYNNSNVSGKAVNTVQLLSPASFPDSTTTTGWRTTWISQSQQATTTYPLGHTVSGNLNYNASQTLIAPMYISGNLSIGGAGHQLMIAPDPAVSKPCVLFVHGNVSLAAGTSLLNEGVVIVSDGKITLNGGPGANSYSASDLNDAGLVSFNTDPNNAINIQSGHGISSQVGMLYAVNGGATLGGGASFYGSLTTGGTTGTANLAGGSAISYAPGFNSTKGPFVPQWLVSSLSKWVSVK